MNFKVTNKAKVDLTINVGGRVYVIKAKESLIQSKEIANRFAYIFKRFVRVAETEELIEDEVTNTEQPEADIAPASDQSESKQETDGDEEVKETMVKQPAKKKSKK